MRDRDQLWGSSAVYVIWAVAAWLVVNVLAVEFISKVLTVWARMMETCSGLN